MGEANPPNLPPLAQEPLQQPQPEPPVAVRPIAGIPPPPGPPPEDKSADRPHGITIWLAIAALIVSAASAAFQQVNAVRARKEAAQASEKQATDVERSRIAAENSAESGRVLAAATLRALDLQSRGTTAVEMNAQATGSLAKEEQTIREIIARSQSARLMVRLNPYSDTKNGADSRKLLLVNGSSIPALRVEVGYQIHTLGMPDQADLTWRVLNEPEPPVSESADFYQKAIERLKPRYSVDFLAPGTGVTVADTLPAPKWFLFLMPEKWTDSSTIPVPNKYAPSSATRLMSAVVFGYVRYADNANESKKMPFCFPLDPKKIDPNCQRVNSIE